MIRKNSMKNMSENLIEKDVNVEEFYKENINK
jgi:hypothetical protein